MSYIISEDRLKSRLEESGYKTIEALARAIGVHRNTIHHYLSGAAVFPSALEKIFAALQVAPWDVVTIKRTSYDVQIVSPIVDRLNRALPEACYVLFGSRARNQEKRFSDFDIGVYVARKLSLEEFSNLLESISTLTDELPIEIDLVNLTKADSAFFETMRSGCKFLGGSPLSYGALMKRMYE